LKTYVFQELLNRGEPRNPDGKQRRELGFLIFPCGGNDYLLLPENPRLALIAIELYHPVSSGDRLRKSYTRAALRWGFPTRLERLEVRVAASSPLVDYLIEAPGLLNEELRFAVASRGAGRFEVLLFNTLERPAAVVRIGVGDRLEETISEGKTLAEGSSRVVLPAQKISRGVVAYTYHCPAGVGVEESISDHDVSGSDSVVGEGGFLGRVTSKVMRRVLFLREFYQIKRAQIAGHVKRWVRKGIEPTPLPDKIDVVYLWRDESDQDWLARREADVEKFQRGKGYNRGDLGAHATATSLDRLKYSMRSVDKYFGSLGKIYIITDRQQPEWLNLDDPRVEIIDHKEIFEDKDYLPSYNSQAIESYMHRVPGLSEFFVYLNDDFFINHPVTPEDFFTEDGKILLRLGRGLTARGVAIVEEGGDTSAQKNANLILDRDFRKERRPTVMHRPYAHRKSLMSRAEEEFPEAFHLTRRSHFRSVEMVALHNLLVPFWGYYAGEVQLLPTQLFRKDMFYWSNDKGHNDKVLERIREFEQISFCIQADLSTDLTEESVADYHRALETIFPEKSSFEL